MKSSHIFGPPAPSAIERAENVGEAGVCTVPHVPRAAITGTSWMAFSVRL